MPNRMISLERNTNETQIDLTLDLDGTGRYEDCPAAAQEKAIAEAKALAEAE